jgi:hypothetical protein
MKFESPNSGNVFRKGAKAQNANFNEGINRQKPSPQSQQI